MTMTREEQIRKKAKELGQQYFPDSSNIWARSNVEACYVENACIEMAEWVDQHPQWIPVEERLPEETEVVLGVREGGTDVEMYKFMGFNESTNTFDWEWHPYYRAVVDDVTHWMPIVPPRKEEKNELW